jgi:hypothetical protein
LRKTACFFALVNWRSAWRKKTQEKVQARHRGGAPKPLLPPLASHALPRVARAACCWALRCVRRNGGPETEARERKRRNPIF